MISDHMEKNKMQYLKDNIRNKILESAKEEFFKNGYAKGSLRTIATNAGITVGNIYRYYDSKEALLNKILNPFYMEITKEALKYGLIPLRQTSLDSSLLVIEDLLIRYRQEVAILVREPVGDNIRKILLGFVSKRMVKEMSCEKPLAKILSITFVDSLYTILREHINDPKTAIRYIRKLITIFFIQSDEIKLYE